MAGGAESKTGAKSKEGLEWNTMTILGARCQVQSSGSFTAQLIWPEVKKQNQTGPEAMCY